MGQGTIIRVGQTSEKPATIFRIHKIPLLATNIGIFGHWPDFGTSVTGRGLGGPDAHLPAVVEDQTVGTTVFENGIVVFVLVEFDATVELGTICRVAVVTLSGTF